MFFVLFNAVPVSPKIISTVLNSVNANFACYFQLQSIFLCLFSFRMSEHGPGLWETINLPFFFPDRNCVFLKILLKGDFEITHNNVQQCTSILYFLWLGCVKKLKRQLWILYVEDFPQQIIHVEKLAFWNSSSTPNIQFCLWFGIYVKQLFNSFNIFKSAASFQCFQKICFQHIVLEDEGFSMILNPSFLTKE